MYFLYVLQALTYAKLRMTLLSSAKGWFMKKFILLISLVFFSQSIFAQDYYRIMGNFQKNTCAQQLALLDNPLTMFLSPFYFLKIEKASKFYTAAWYYAEESNVLRLNPSHDRLFKKTLKKINHKTKLNMSTSDFAKLVKKLDRIKSFCPKNEDQARDQMSIREMKKYLIRCLKTETSECYN